MKVPNSFDLDQTRLNVGLILIKIVCIGYQEMTNGKIFRNKFMYYQD